MPTLEDTILIIEPDSGLQAMFKAYFASVEGFQIHVVETGQDGIDTALKIRPRAIVIETKLPDKPGVVVFRQLQAYPRTAHIPVLFLAGGTEVFLKNQILSEGAHDFLQKPIDVAELTLRLRNTLRISEQDGTIDPITRLPSGDATHQKIEDLLKTDQFMRIDVRIEGYDTFSDLNGFFSAHEVILFASNIITELVHEIGTPKDFVGQLDEEVFVILTHPAKEAQMMDALRVRLGSQLPQFHNFIERDQGYVEIINPNGNSTRKALMSLHLHAEKIGEAL